MNKAQLEITIINAVIVSLSHIHYICMSTLKIKQEVILQV